MVKLKKPGDDFDQGEQMGAAESRIKRTEEMRRFGDESALPKADPEREAFLAIPRVNCLGYYFTF